MVEEQDGVRKIFLGLDPGSKGGLAAITPSVVLAVSCASMSLQDLWDWVKQWSQEPTLLLNDEEGEVFLKTERVEVYALLERVGGFITREEGEARHRGSPMFNFGRTYGHLEMALTAAGIKFHTMTPLVWQKHINLEPRQAEKVDRKKVYTETQREWKNRLKAYAQTLFPTVKVTLGTCDALILAELCRRTYQQLSEEEDPGTRRITERPKDKKKRRAAARKRKRSGKKRMEQKEGE
jgi:hypothetical protein